MRNPLELHEKIGFQKMTPKSAAVVRALHKKVKDSAA
jgi:hypothetical protein